MAASADPARSEREHADDCATHWDLAAECTCTQSGRWPWWRLACAAMLPWLIGILVGIAGAPLWGAVGFGALAFLMGMVGAAASDAIRDVRDGL